MEFVDLSKGVARYFSEIISVESGIKMLTSAIYCKKRKIYFRTDFLRIRLNIQKSKHLNFMANGNVKTTFGMF